MSSKCIKSTKGGRGRERNIINNAEKREINTTTEKVIEIRKRILLQDAEINP